MDLLELPPKTQDHIHAAKGMKETVCEPGECRDILPFIDFWRDDMPVAVVTCPEVNRDAALQACSFGIPGWAADHIILFLDTLVADPTFTKKFGRMPDPGELQELKADKRACEMGLVDEAISIIECWRDGRKRFTSIPYHVHEKSGTVHWVDEKGFSFHDDGHSEEKAGGLVIDIINRCFEKPPVGLNTLPIDYTMFDINAEQARIHIDLALMRVLTEAGFAVLFACPTPLHEEMLKNTAENSPCLQLRDPDGEILVDVREPTEEDLSNMVPGYYLRQKLEEERELSHYEMKADRERRQAERGAKLLAELESDESS